VDDDARALVVEALLEAASNSLAVWASSSPLRSRTQTSSSGERNVTEKELTVGKVGG